MKKSLVVGLLSVGMLVGCSEVTQEVAEEAQKVTEEVQKPSEGETKEEAPKAVETTLGAGKFYVGEDIPAGRYVVSTKEAMGNFHVGFEVIEILGTDPDMAVNNITVTLEEGQEIEIMGLNEVLFQPK